MLGAHCCLWKMIQRTESFFFQARLEVPAAAERKESKEQVPLLALSLSGNKFVFDLFTALFIRKLMLMINQNGSVMLGYWS